MHQLNQEPGVGPLNLLKSQQTFAFVVSSFYLHVQNIQNYSCGCFMEILTTLHTSACLCSKKSLVQVKSHHDHII